MAWRERPRYHVSPSANRASISGFGLDWNRMHPDQRGIAGSWPGQPETEGIFLTHSEIGDARFFVWMGGGRRVDIWRVDVTDLPLEDLSGEGGWWICREVISPTRLTLVEVWDTSEETPQDLRRVPLPRARDLRRSRKRA